MIVKGAIESYIMDQLIRKNKIISTLNDGIDSLIDPEDKIEVVKDLKAYSHFKLDLLNSNNNNIVTTTQMKIIII